MERIQMQVASDHNLVGLGLRQRGAFTLVEILIVVVILGILATIVIPQFGNASQQAQESTLKDDLRYLRTQFVVFRAQHRDVSPGYPNGNAAAAPTTAALEAQLTQYSDDRCNTRATATASCRFGPYMQKIPANPRNTLNTVKVIANGQPLPKADDSTGWIYKPQTLEVIANSTGRDSSGTPFSQY